MIFSIALASVVAVSLIAMGAITLCNNLNIQAHARRTPNGAGEMPLYEHLGEKAALLRRKCGEIPGKIWDHYRDAIAFLVAVFTSTFLFPDQKNLTEVVALLFVFLSGVWGVYIVWTIVGISKLATEVLKIELID